MKSKTALIILLFSVILISLLESCASKTNKIPDAEFIEINVDPMSSKETKLSEIADRIRYVKLETNPECLIGNARSMRFYQDRILVYESNTILCFDEDGSYKFKINKKGKGPGEYTAINDYLINDLTKTIEILDSRGRKILRFDIDGKFIEEIVIDMIPNRFAVNDSSSYYYYTMGADLYDREEYSYNLIRVKKDGQTVISKHFKQTENMTYYQNSSFSKFNDVLTFSYNHFDTIYSINKTGEIKPMFFINFGDKNNEIIKELGTINRDNRTKRFEIQSNKNYIGGLSSVSSSDLFLFFKYSVTEEVNQEMKYRQGYINEILYSKKTDKYFNIKKSIINDMDGIPLSIPLKVINNELVFVVQPIDIIEEMKNDNSPEFNKTIKKLSPIKESDNPIVVFVKIKKF